MVQSVHMITALDLLEQERTMVEKQERAKLRRRSQTNEDQSFTYKEAESRQANKNSAHRCCRGVMNAGVWEE
jgi:hypothetical protein